MSMDQYNPLNEYPQARKHLYLVQWIVNLLMGVGAIVFVSLGETPAWFVVVGGVFNFVWTYSGITARANVVDGEAAPPA